MKEFIDKKWKELSFSEVYSVARNGDVIICKSHSQEGGMRFSVFRYEIYPRSYSPDLIGGGDICFKAHCGTIELARAVAEIVSKEPKPFPELERQIG